VTHSSEPLATLSTRRARRAERQARVGLLRNPNTPPEPPRRKARLMGKWPSLQTTRRPHAQAQPADSAPPALSDAELAQRLKSALPPLPAPLPPPGCDTLPDSPDPHTPSAPTGNPRRALALLAGFGVLIAVALIAAPL